MERTSKLSHFDEAGASRMVDVSDKDVTDRIAVAHAQVTMKEETFGLITNKEIAKGDVLEVARVAGIMAAKQTGALIPMCHPLNLTSVRIDYSLQGNNSVEILAEVRVAAKTGVEMEALTAASVCALTIYDMCKSVDRSMVINDIHLVRKSGGKSGDFEFS